MMHMFPHQADTDQHWLSVRVVFLLRFISTVCWKHYVALEQLCVHRLVTTVFSVVGYKNKKENLWAFHLKGTLCVHQSLWVTPFTLHTHRFSSFFYSKNTHWYRIYKIYNMTQHHGQEKDWLYLQLQYLFVKKIMKYLIILNYLHSIVILVRCVYSSLTVS